MHGDLIDLAGLHVELFADGANLAAMRGLCGQPLVRGFTTNPTLMRQAGVSDYRTFAREVLAIAGGRPVSFEVLSDDLVDMDRQAREIASWSPSVFVKIPVTNTRGDSTGRLVHCLSRSGVQVNVTAVMTLDQIEHACAALAGGAAANVSVFAGRIADTGRDPAPIVAAAVEIAAATPNVRIIWASPREVLNVFQADDAGCHVITLTPDLLRKLALVGRDLDAFSLETVRMFFCDAQAAGLQL
jgi:transaldolase